MTTPSFGFNATATQRGPGENLYLTNGAPQDPVIIGTDKDITRDYQIFSNSNGFWITPPNWSGSTIDSLLYVDANLYRTSMMGTNVFQSGEHQIQVPYDYYDPYTPLLGPKVVFIPDGTDSSRMGVIGMSADFGYSGGTYHFPSSMTMGVYNSLASSRVPAMAMDINSYAYVTTSLLRCSPTSISTVQGVYPYVSNNSNPALRQEISTVTIPAGNAGTITFAKPFVNPPTVIATGQYAINVSNVTNSNFNWSVVAAPGLSNVNFVNYLANGA